jgi:hypothetical protein
MLAKHLIVPLEEVAHQGYEHRPKHEYEAHENLNMERV